MFGHSSERPPRPRRRPHLVHPALAAQRVRPPHDARGVQVGVVQRNHGVAVNQPRLLQRAIPGAGGSGGGHGDARVEAVAADGVWRRLPHALLPGRPRPPRARLAPHLANLPAPQPATHACDTHAPSHVHLRLHDVRVEEQQVDVAAVQVGGRQLPHILRAGSGEAAGRQAPGQGSSAQRSRLLAQAGGPGAGRRHAGPAPPPHTQAHAARPAGVARLLDALVAAGVLRRHLDKVNRVHQAVEGGHGLRGHQCGVAWWRWARGQQRVQWRPARDASHAGGSRHTRVEAVVASCAARHGPSLLVHTARIGARHMQPMPALRPTLATFKKLRAE